MDYEVLINQLVLLKKREISLSKLYYYVFGLIRLKRIGDDIQSCAIFTKLL